MLELDYQSGTAFLKRVWNLDEAEVLIRCPICKAKVIFAPSWETAHKYKVHPGAYCSVDRKHLTVMFELTPPPLTPVPPRNDTSIFGNNEGLLPAKPRGYYREYVVPTPGINHAGKRRIVEGLDGELYYSHQHYADFVLLN
ncbi:ribonuclease [Prosthecobacter fusiformis]|uniref:Ribonuclease n=1 Tax=Prosthecobacter fusiformis TaxID=48464 RepID=A0A4R7S199_9BACT|nr:ribonuclease domain-containing protein [Prosthecobacter fusiformis]TDU71178.1 ribonuclease [Prosthecobacter fusiformis]